MVKFGISTVVMSDKDVFCSIEIIRKSSFKFIEIRCEKGHFNYEDIKEIKKLKATLKKNALTCSSLHPPLWVNIAAKEEWERMRSVREVEKIILVANRLGVPIVILHPGRGAGNIETSYLSLEEILDFAKEWRVQIVLENTFLGNFASHFSEFQAISNKFDVHLCIDTSHANAKEDQLDKFLEAFDGRIKHFHLSDSRMEGRDDHLIPYEGKINWKPITEFLNKSDGFAIFEILPRENFYPEGSDYIIRKLDEIKTRWEK
ncbi:MAG: sugar phosphate isomerase/epimerase family protein [candidate division WOR-3 bacterium]